MVQAQEYLANYFKNTKCRDDIEDFDISKQNLTGSLKIENFARLKILNCSYNQLISLEIINCPYLTSFDCFNNRIERLIIKDLPQLNRIACYNNQLTNADFLTNLPLFDKEKLTILSLVNNKFQGNLEFLSPFVNLVHLELSGNYFDFSLEHLQNMKKLKKLWTNALSIDEKLEYLPNSLEHLCCYSRVDEEPCQLSQELVKKYQTKDNRGDIYYNYQAWRKDYLARCVQEKNKKIQELENEVQRLVSLIKDKKEKIIEAYLHSFPESQKELLQQLITAHLEYSKTKKQDQKARLTLS